MASETQDAMVRTLGRVSAVLRPARIPFAVTGGCAVYARGGPATGHDLDLLVREGDVPAAVRALVLSGMRAADPPEDWLAKVYDDDVLVDLLYRPSERPVTDDVLARAEPVRIGETVVPVQRATDLLVNKLLVLGADRCDLAELLPIARALTAQIDWPAVRDRTAGSPYAEAFLLLVRRLDIAGPEAGGSER